MDENKHLKNENNDLTERINNLSYILADLQQKTKNAEQERDSVITAMRLLIAETNGVVENNNLLNKSCAMKRISAPSQKMLLTRILN